MENKDILYIYYGAVTPLTDPVTQLIGITALAIHREDYNGSKVCFAEYRGTSAIDGVATLDLDIKSTWFRGRITKKGDLWCYKGYQVYVLVDVTERLKNRLRDQK